MFAKKSFSASPAALLARLHGEVAACASPELEDGRAWLVFAGQIEQAVRDCGGSTDIQAVTDRAAELFLALLFGEACEEARRGLLQALAGALADDAQAEVRIAEGFAWYALYPDSYADAARKWVAARWRGEAVLVIGLRSIGTSLSAVVAGALKRHGVAARRITLRPEGHPFAREASLPRDAGGADAVIVVDEGPGLSGSSMAGVAGALLARGVGEDAISFFPGHKRGPGPMASETVRRWWTAERCWVGEAPGELIAPAPGLHWIFGGFAAMNDRLETLAAVKRARQMRMAAQQLACPCPAVANGWLGIAADGTALRRDDLSPALVRKTLAGYITRAALPCTEDDVRRDAIARIAGAIGVEADARVAAASRALPLAGDGRLMPHEWLRKADGRVLKRDATGSDCAHDWAGPQSLLWDVAGAIAEWEMDDRVRHALLTALAEDHGLVADARALAFHEAGYCCLARDRARHGGDQVKAGRFDAMMHGALARMEALG